MVAVPWLDLVVSGRTLAESDVVLTTDWWLAGALSPRGTLGAEAEEKERPRNTYQNTRQFKVKSKLNSSHKLTKTLTLVYLSC